MMIYTDDEIENGAAAMTSCLNCFDAAIKYGVDRSKTVILWTTNLFFQELDYYKTFIKD